jgi:tRNA pseudouridine55 synthase
MSPSNGSLLVDKPQGLTSHDVVARVRRVLSERRVGHAGTLDPMATGLLVLAAGPATRLLSYAQATTKRYVGVARLGVATDSLDADGAVLATAAVAPFDEANLARVAGSLTGEILQVPPMVSALKVNGKRLHELARAGEEVERAPRTIRIERFALTRGDEPDTLLFDVTCSTGTYVRVLLADAAESLGTLGHLTALRRMSSGAKRVEDAWNLDELMSAGPDVAVLGPARDLFG